MSNTLSSALPVHFTYLIEVVKDGKVIESEVAQNIVPIEGLNHILSTVLASGTPITSWSIGLFQGNYTPVPEDRAATFATMATETTAYTGTTRLPFTPGTAVGGGLSNAAAVAEFAFPGPASVTVYGGFLISSNVRGGTVGTLLSAVRFASAKVMDPGATLRVTAGLLLTSA